MPTCPRIPTWSRSGWPTASTPAGGVSTETPFASWTACVSWGPRCGSTSVTWTWPSAWNGRAGFVRVRARPRPSRPSHPPWGSARESCPWPIGPSGRASWPAVAGGHYRSSSSAGGMRPRCRTWIFGVAAPPSPRRRSSRRSGTPGRSSSGPPTRSSRSARSWLCRDSATRSRPAPHRQWRSAQSWQDASSRVRPRPSCAGAGKSLDAAGVANLYAPLLDGMVADERSAPLPTLEMDTTMDSADQRRHVAEQTLTLALGLS